MLVLLLGSWACTGAFVAAGPTADVGTLGVSGLQVGAALSRGRRWPMVAWVAGPRAGGLVAHVGAGLQGGRPALQWWIALRERPAGLLGGGQAEFFSSTQLVFGLAVGRQ